MTWRKDSSWKSVQFEYLICLNSEKSSSLAKAYPTPHTLVWPKKATLHNQYFHIFHFYPFHLFSSWGKESSVGDHLYFGSCISNFFWLASSNVGLVFDWAHQLCTYVSLLRNVRLRIYIHDLYRTIEPLITIHSRCDLGLFVVCICQQPLKTSRGVRTK